MGDMSGLQAGAAWPMFGGGPAHAGRSLHVGTRVPGIKWEFATGAERVFFPPAIAADGTIYLGPKDPTLHAISPDGKSIWQFLTEGSELSTPAIGADGTVYLMTREGNLYAIDSSGRRRWQLDTDDKTWSVSGMHSPPTIGADGTIYVVSPANWLLAVAPDGRVKWKVEVGGGYLDSAAIGHDGTLYVGNYESLDAISPDGRKLWSCKDEEFEREERERVDWEMEMRSPRFSVPAVGPDGTVYVMGLVSGRLYAVRRDGVISWRCRCPGDDRSGSVPAIGSDGTAYVGTSKSSLVAFASNGAVSWQHGAEAGATSPELHDGTWRSPTIGADGMVYVGCGDGSLKAVDPWGRTAWRLPIPGAISSSPVIGADGTIYVGSCDGRLLAIGR